LLTATVWLAGLLPPALALKVRDDGVSTMTAPEPTVNVTVSEADVTPGRLELTGTVAV